MSEYQRKVLTNTLQDYEEELKKLECQLQYKKKQIEKVQRKLETLPEIKTPALLNLGQYDQLIDALKQHDKKKFNHTLWKLWRNMKPECFSLSKDFNRKFLAVYLKESIIVEASYVHIDDEIKWNCDQPWNSYISFKYTSKLHHNISVPERVIKVRSPEKFIPTLNMVGHTSILLGSGISRNLDLNQFLSEASHVESDHSGVTKRELEVLVSGVVYIYCEDS